MTIEQSIRIGSGATALARAQATKVSKLIYESSGSSAQFVRLPADSSGVDGATQVGLLREALLRGDVDMIVHAFKDIPPTPFQGTSLFTPERESAQEALCSKLGEPLDFLAPGARVGVDSPIRRFQLRELRPDLKPVTVHGDLVEQLGQAGIVVSGARGTSQTAHFDAVILGAAALNRIGASHAITELLPFSVMLPAPGQGAIAIEVSDALEATNPGLFSALRSIHHQATFLALSAEQAVVRELASTNIDGVATYAHVSMGSLKIQGVTAQGTTSKLTTARTTTPVSTVHEANEAGRALAHELLG